MPQAGKEYGNRVVEHIQKNVERELHLEHRTVELEGHHIVALTVAPRGDGEDIAAVRRFGYSDIYVRRGATTREANSQEITSLAPKGRSS